MTQELLALKTAVGYFQHCMENLSTSITTMIERQKAARNLAQAMLNENKLEAEYLKLIVELLQ